MIMYGPFPVRVYVDGVLTDQLAPGLHYTVCPDTYEENQESLMPYRVYPTNPLQFVMAGDDPVSGHPNTIPLCFPDQAAIDNLGASTFNLVTPHQEEL